MKITTQILLLIVLMGCSPTNPKGKGVSISKGTVKNGELINGRRFPKKGSNYKYFSKITYFLKNRAWVNAKVLDIAIEAYKKCEITMPKRKFLLMECSHKKGGRMWPHRTHQNGTSIDFASPLKKNEKPYHGDQWKGVFHYAMQFDAFGRWKRNKNISIDFEAIGKHILALEKEANKRNMFIKKVLLKINLKDEFFKTKSGKKVKSKGIYFAKYLPKLIDDVHDDHYHIDFAFKR